MYKFFIGLLLIASTVYADLITTIDFDFDDTSLSWTPPGETQLFYYDLAYFIVDTSGSWTATNTTITSHDSYSYNETAQGFSEADTYIYLYQNTFDVSDVNKNLLAEDDDGYDGGNGYQFELTQNLIAGATYWAVISSYDPGEFISGTVDIYGPNGSRIDISIIPEPTTFGLTIGGFALILLLLKRK